MLRRFPLSFRSQAYSETDFYKLAPLGRKPVAPGESLSTIVADVRFISAVFPKVMTTPILAQIWAFYVPNRLIWDQWIDFIALDDTTIKVPTNTTAWPQMFEPGATEKSSLARRGYKLIYNQFFGDEKVGQTNGAWYDNIATDTVVATNRLLAWDQAVAAQALTGPYVQSAFSAVVTGGSASIPLDDFARSLRNNTARRRQKETGDKYVDTMRMMGVELDWRVQQAPEYLGSSQAVILPRERSSSGTDLTQRVSEWSGRCQFTSKRRMAFAEHGYVWLMVGFRPASMRSGSQQLDNTFTGQFDFYRPDADTVGEIGSTMRERYQGYLKGFNVVGSNENGNVFEVGTGSPGAFYPDPSTYLVAATSGPRHMAFTADLSYRGLTPVPSARG